MRRTIVCISLALILASSIAWGVNRDPIGDGLLWMPYGFGLGYQGNEVIAALLSQGYSPIRMINNSGGAGTTVNIDLLKWYLNVDQSSFRGVMWVHTHGNSSCATHEAYLSEDTRDTAFDYWKRHGWSEDDIVESESEHGYGISIYPSKISWEFAGGHQELIMYCACFSNGWIRDAYNDARCTVACTGIGSAADYLPVMERLNGHHGISMRSVGQAISGISGLASQGDSATVLTACVVSVTPSDGSDISGETTVTVEFDSEMDEDTSYRWPVVADNALVDNLEWHGNELEFTLSPYQEGTVTVDVIALSAGINELDGNRNPDGTNGYGPNGDSYRFTYSSGEENESPNTAVSFEGAGAFEAEDGTHVWWVTDPELGSICFEVYGGTNRSQLLASVPASGGPDRSFFYEMTMPACDVYEVVEVDNDPTTEYATRPFYPSGPPENIDLLREMNARYGTWTPYVWESGERDESLVLPATRLVFYSPRSDFLLACLPIRLWWQEQGYTSQTYLGTENPYDCQEVARAVYEAAIEEEQPWLPQMVVVGEDNQGSVPAYNVVGTIYLEDEDDQCYWSSCASDASIVEFDGDKLPDITWTRILAHGIGELQNEVAWMMEYYERAYPQSPRAVILDGDLNAACEPTVEPRATLSLIQDRLEAGGVQTVMINDSDVSDCGDFVARHDWACAEINAGITELIGNGVGTSRSILPGYFLQKMFYPIFALTDLTRVQRIVVEMPGCGMGDTDRDNPSYYPSMPKLCMAGNPANGTKAVVWLSHKRGGQQALHLALARAYFEQRMRYPYRTIQENYFNAIRMLGIENPAMRDYLLMAGAYGFPARIAEMYAPGAVEEPTYSGPTGLSVSPNPIVGPGSELSFGLRGFGRVGLQVIDIQGRCLRKLVDREVFEPGLHRINWDGRDDAGRSLSAGVYYARLTVNQHDRAFAKFILLH